MTTAQIIIASINMAACAIAYRVLGVSGAIGTIVGFAIYWSIIK